MTLYSNRREGCKWNDCTVNEEINYSDLNQSPYPIAKSFVCELRRNTRYTLPRNNSTIYMSVKCARESVNIKRICVLIHVVKHVTQVDRDIWHETRTNTKTLNYRIFR